MLSLEAEKHHLAKADRDIAEGEERIIRQVALLERLRRDGHDAGAAETLLETLRQTQAAWRTHRDIILAEIGRLEREGSKVGAGDWPDDDQPAIDPPP